MPHVIVRADGDGVRVDEVEDLKRLHVESSLDLDALRAAVEAAGAGSVTGDGHVALDPGWLRAAGPDGDRTWSEGFDAMVGYARSKGWVDDAGAIRAHVERPG